MKKSKNGYLNKIIIYQLPLIDRILTIGQCLLILIPVIGLILGFERVIETIIILLVLIVYCIDINYAAFIFHDYSLKSCTCKQQ